MEVGRKMEKDHDKANMKFEETELRLGLPGGGGGGGGGGGVEGDIHGVKNSNNTNNNNGKRGYEEIVDLKLNLSSSKVQIEKVKIMHSNDPPKPPAKAQVVGWPPVRSFRKNILTVQKSGSDEEKEKLIGGVAAFVKVSLDGAPYLRKVDLKTHKTYKELSDALGNLFSSFTIGNCGMKDFMNESKLMDLLSGSDFVPTYEDKDGDWMLVGDVPWEMFVNSCKRLRIMKGTEAKGLAPRAMEKCKNRD